MEMNRIIYGAWAVLLLGAVCIAAYNLEPSTAELQQSSEIGESGSPDAFASLAQSDQGRVEPTEFLQDRVPGRLPVVSDTDPLADAKLKVLRRIVKEEMPDASADEVRIWTEEFKDLPEDAVRFMLKQKRRSDGAPPIAIPELVPETATPPNQSALAVTIEKAKAITTRNLMNQNTWGYRRQTVEFFGSSTDRIQIAEVTTRSRSDANPLAETGRQFDFATRDGLFVLIEDGETWFTNVGRFSLNNDRQLSLRVGDRELIPEGINAVPKGATSVQISDSGELTATVGADQTTLGRFRVATFLDAARLYTDDGCLFRQHGASGQPRFVDKPTILQGCLEPSNVLPSEEERLLEQLQQWSELLD